MPIEEEQDDLVATCRYSASGPWNLPNQARLRALHGLGTMGRR